MNDVTVIISVIIIVMPSKLIDLTGKKFKKWTVLRHSHVTKKANGSTVHHWLCKCECGSERSVTGDSLNKGHSGSCGCINKQLARNHPSWQGYEDISASFWKQYKWSAKARQIPFDITMEYAWRLYLKQNKMCALTGLSLSFPKDARDTTHNASLDRIDPEGGYFQGNVQWVDKRINIMKMMLRNEEFVSLCRLVVKYERVF